MTENIFLGHEIVARGMLDKPAMRAAVAELIDRLNLRFSPDTIVRDLGPAQRQLVPDRQGIVAQDPRPHPRRADRGATDNEIGYLFGLLAKLRPRASA